MIEGGYEMGDVFLDVILMGFGFFFGLCIVVEYFLYVNFVFVGINFLIKGFIVLIIWMLIL